MSDTNSPPAPNPTVDDEYADRLIRAMTAHQSRQGQPLAEQQTPVTNTPTPSTIAVSSPAGAGAVRRGRQLGLLRTAPYTASLARLRGVRSADLLRARQTGRSVVSGGEIPGGEDDGDGNGGDDDDDEGDANSRFSDGRSKAPTRGGNVHDSEDDGDVEQGEVGENKVDKGGEEQNDQDDDDDEDDDSNDENGQERARKGVKTKGAPKTRTVIQTAPVWVIRNTCPVLVCRNKFPDEKNRDLIGRHLRWAMKSGKLQPEHAEQHRLWTEAGARQGTAKERHRLEQQNYRTRRPVKSKEVDRKGRWTYQARKEGYRGGEALKRAQEKAANWRPKGTPKEGEVDDDGEEAAGNDDDEEMGEGGELGDGELDRELFGDSDNEGDDAN